MGYRTVDGAERSRLLEWVQRYQQLAHGPALGWMYPTFAHLITHFGRFYPPSVWPLTEGRFPPGQCFAASSYHANRAGWTYVEGFVLHPQAAPFEVYEHAWCLTQAGDVADATLPDGQPLAYLGIPLTHDFRCAQQQARDTDAVITLDGRNPLAGLNARILADGLPAHALAAHRYS